MMSICSRYESNSEDAKATLNLCFLKIIIHLEKYKPEIPFKLWARRITINTIIDEFRKNKKVKEAISVVDFQNEVRELHGYDINTYISKINAEEIAGMINELPEMQRKIFNLYVVDGFDHNEIAKMLEIPAGTSRWHLSVAKENLKEKFMRTQEKNYKYFAS